MAQETHSLQATCGATDEEPWEMALSSEDEQSEDDESVVTDEGFILPTKQPSPVKGTTKTTRAMRFHVGLATPTKQASASPSN